MRGKPVMSLTVVILTRNEERHITRALASVAAIADHCFVIDSGSTDETVALARASGAVVFVNPFQNQAQQFNWALTQLPTDTEWILRLDADEIVSQELADEIDKGLPIQRSNICGVYVSRRMTFLRRPIRWGGVFPLRILRLFRFGHGRYENRWMDEHLIIDGSTAHFFGEIIDDNVNSLTFWTEKHNFYSSREVVDILNQEFGFMPRETTACLVGGQQTGVKRWIKENVYARLPGGFRAFAYFFYRYVIRFGFLDGKEGTAFHVLQGFWYRYLVDLKLLEVTRYMTRHGVGVHEAILNVLGIDVGPREEG